MEHLIANSGIQFIETSMEFNPTEPLNIGGKTLKYSFFEIYNPTTGNMLLDLAYFNSTDTAGKYIPLNEIRQQEAYEKLPDGREDLDPMGMLKLNPYANPTQFSQYDDGSKEIISINSLNSYRLPDPNNRGNRLLAFDMLLNHWLPMPMFEKDMTGITVDYPYAWCRVRIEDLGETKKGLHKFRLIWAFDTQLGEDDLQNLRPFFFEFDSPTKNYTLCNRVDELLGFMSTSEKFHAFSDHIRSLLNIPDSELSNRYIAFYIYLINFIRLGKGAPEVALHNLQKTIPVDMVLDIGNSRTCGVLFESGDFTKAMMLGLRDLTHPDRMYVKSFDMRLAFRMADLGNDIVLSDDSLFRWKSFLRIGDEARNLIYNSVEDEGLTQTKNNYSSPKRYIWDDKSSEDNWQFLNTVDDPFFIGIADNIYVPVLSDLFDSKGQFCRDGKKQDFLENKNARYSRSSLMTFVLIEIFQHAITQINSIAFRKKHGNIDCRRILRNIILTCPTAMPQAEQIKLRQFAQDAYDAVAICNTFTSCRMGDFSSAVEGHCEAQGMPAVTILPTAESLRITDDFDDSGRRMWSYDEASCCQLVYLYAEIAERYRGEIHRFFELKGHIRPEDIEEGYEGKSITIGTVDIGAGTTDVMICSYRCQGEGNSRLTPIPLFWDSFYMAGDDILRSLVQNFVIEGTNFEDPSIGNISSALKARVKNMTTDEMMQVKKWSENIVYSEKIRQLMRFSDPERQRQIKRSLCIDLIRDFFGVDSAMMSFRDRRNRVDFNTQISVPIAQFFMEQLRTKMPSRRFTFDELFPENKPAAYLLDYFEEHFGFRFEELEWVYDAQAVAKAVKDTMEQLLKQISVVLYSHHCDILVLAGRPTSLDPITELFIKYLPIAPDRLIRLNDYRVGNWYPFADGQGYFYDHKSIVAVGGMVGYLASTAGFGGMVLDFERMIKTMKSTAKYMGLYNTHSMKVNQSFLTPEKGTPSVNIAVFPAFIGCKQFDTPIYLARPIYAIYDHANRGALKVTFSRNYQENREAIQIEEITDSMGNNVPKSSVELVQQSLVDDGSFWLDKGEFELSL